jgi:hypothetical protein
MQQALFPFRIYSVPIAKKIGLDSAVAIQFLIEKYGESSFTIWQSQMDGIGCNYANVLSGLSNIIIRQPDGQYKIDFVALSSLTEPELKDARLCDNELVKAIKMWSKYLKSKGKDKTFQQLLVELNGWDRNDLINSIIYSKDNGFVTLFRKKAGGNIRKDHCGGGVGGPTEADSKRDYSELIDT